MQEPKFSPGEPAIDMPLPHENGELRVIVMSVEWSERLGAYTYWTLPERNPGHMVKEKYLRPLPPEELAGCFDANEVSRKDEVSA